MAEPKNAHSHPMEKHPSHKGRPYGGPFVCDATSASSILLDLPPGATRGLKHEKPGYDEVQVELKATMPTHGKESGVSDAVYQEIVDLDAKIKLLKPILTQAEKLAEVCRETLIALEDEREGALAQVADVVTSTANRKRVPALKAPWEKTIAYVNQVGKKAAAAREANKRKKAGGANQK